jgi:hypothetical protein
MDLLPDELVRHEIWDWLSASAQRYFVLAYARAWRLGLRPQRTFRRWAEQCAYDDDVQGMWAAMPPRRAPDLSLFIAAVRGGSSSALQQLLNITQRAIDHNVCLQRHASATNHESCMNVCFDRWLWGQYAKANPLLSGTRVRPVGAWRRSVLRPWRDPMRRGDIPWALVLLQGNAAALSPARRHAFLSEAVACGYTQVLQQYGPAECCRASHVTYALEQGRSVAGLEWVLAHWPGTAPENAVWFSGMKRAARHGALRSLHWLEGRGHFDQRWAFTAWDRALRGGHTTILDWLWQCWPNNREAFRSRAFSLSADYLSRHACRTGNVPFLAWLWQCYLINPSNAPGLFFHNHDQVLVMRWLRDTCGFRPAAHERHSWLQRHFSDQRQQHLSQTRRDYERIRVCRFMLDDIWGGSEPLLPRIVTHLAPGTVDARDPTGSTKYRGIFLLDARGVAHYDGDWDVLLAMQKHYASAGTLYRGVNTL